MTDLTYLSLLAAGFATVLGSMCMPAFVLVGRTAFVGRLLRSAVLAACKAALARGVRFVAAIVTASAAFMILFTVVTTTPTMAQSNAMPSAASKTVDAIDKLMTKLQAGKKPLPAWAADLAMRAYDIWKTHQNGKRVSAVEKRTAEIEREVLAILEVVADIQAQVEAGQDISDREFRLVRELLDAHCRRLDDLTGRVAILEAKTVEQERQLAISRATTEELRSQLADARVEIGNLTSRVRRPGCGTQHAWRNGKCVNVAMNPR